MYISSQDKIDVLLDKISGAESFPEVSVENWIKNLTKKEGETRIRELQHYIASFVVRGGSIEGLISGEVPQAEKVPQSGRVLPAEKVQEADEVPPIWNLNLQENEKKALQGDSRKVLLALDVLKKIQGKFQGSTKELEKELRVLLSKHNFFELSEYKPLEQAELRVLFDHSLFPSMPLSEQLGTLELLFTPEIIAEYGPNLDDARRLEIIKKCLIAKDDGLLAKKQLEYRTYMKLWNKVAYAKSQQKASEERSLSEDEKQLLEMHSKWLNAATEALKKGIGDISVKAISKAVSSIRRSRLDKPTRKAMEEVLSDLLYEHLADWQERLPGLGGHPSKEELDDFLEAIRGARGIGSRFFGKARQQKVLGLQKDFLAHWQERLLGQDHPSKEELDDFEKAIEKAMLEMVLSDLDASTKKAMHKPLLGLYKEHLAHRQDLLFRQDRYPSQEELDDLGKAIKNAIFKVQTGGFDEPTSGAMHKAFLELHKDLLAHWQERLLSQDHPSKEEIYNFVKAIDKTGWSIECSYGLDGGTRKAMRKAVLELQQEPLAHWHKYLFSSPDSPLPSIKEIFAFSKVIREASNITGRNSFREEVQQPLLALKKNLYFKWFVKAIKRGMWHIVSRKSRALSAKRQQSISEISSLGRLAPNQEQPILRNAPGAGHRGKEKATGVSLSV